MSRAEIQHITILSQGVIILKHCYLNLQVNAKTQTGFNYLHTYNKYLCVVCLNILVF